MPASVPARALEPAAVDAALRRLARAPDPPWLHAEVACRMKERLGLVRLQPRAIIDWWGHTGASAALLAEAYPQARRIVVEPTTALVERSRTAARAPWWSTRRWSQRDADVMLADPGPPDGGAQLLWSNMMLHAAADPPVLLARWQRALAAEGFLMFSCLGPGSLRALQALYRERGWGEPGAAFVDMHDLGDMLVGAGFADPVMDQETITLTWDGPQALLAELRSLGGNASPARPKGLRTPRWREQLHDALHTLTGPDGRPRLDFEIVYGHAFKAVPRAAAGSETVVPLATMRERLRQARGGGKTLG
jgi:malonyl-CoA O-methyltransferase